MIPHDLGPLRWNWPHLVLLAVLLPYAWLAQAAGWSASTLLALGTVLALAWLMLAEWLWPARREWALDGADLRRDAAFLGINAIADAAGSLFLALLALRLAESGPAWAHGAPAWWAVPLAVVVGELGPYALHRWAHRGGWAWRVHAVHHQPGAVNASNNLTTHPVNVLWNQLARSVPWLLLGFDATVIAWAALFVQIQSFAVHANVAGTLGPLSRWIGSAELHRWHHSTDLAEAHNFGTALPLWDHVFGTYRAPSGTGPQRVGIQGLSGQPVLGDWRHLLLGPLCRRCARAC